MRRRAKLGTRLCRSLAAQPVEALGDVLVAVAADDVDVSAGELATEGNLESCRLVLQLEEDSVSQRGIGHQRDPC